MSKNLAAVARSYYSHIAAFHWCLYDSSEFLYWSYGRVKIHILVQIHTGVNTVLSIPVVADWFVGALPCWVMFALCSSKNCVSVSLWDNLVISMVVLLILTTLWRATMQRWMDGKHWILPETWCLYHGRALQLLNSSFVVDNLVLNLPKYRQG